jgi:hypothetical protein
LTLECSDYLFEAVHIFRTQLAKSKVKDVTRATVYACSDFTPWQRNALEFLQPRFNPEVCAPLGACGLWRPAAPLSPHISLHLGHTTMRLLVHVTKRLVRSCALVLQTTPHFAKTVLSELKKAVDVDPEMKKYPKRVMVFAGDVVKTAEVEGIAALSSRWEEHPAHPPPASRRDTTYDPSPPPPYPAEAEARLYLLLLRLCLSCLAHALHACTVAG